MKFQINGSRLMQQGLLVCWYCSLATPQMDAAFEPAECKIAIEGTAQFPVSVSQHASEQTRQNARELVEMLGKICGATFLLQTGDGEQGVVVGQLSDFPEIRKILRKGESPPTVDERENYWIRSHARGVLLIGMTDLAVEHAIWDFLYRLGYRQYFPGEHWEIIPDNKSLQVEINVYQSPDYYSRRIWYGFGPWDYAKIPYARWCKRNRATAGMQLNTGHAYGRIISRNQKAFDAHPEYYALVDGKRDIRPQAKLCISNANLQKLVVQHAIRYFKENKQADSISMDPSDGGGWCECEACKALGKVSDRALLLANRVAAGVNRQSSEKKYVGMYAYAYHSPPPARKVHPQVIISVATSFLKGGYSVDEIISGWSSQGAQIGIREYYSVFTWDHDLPGRSRGANINYLTTTIPKFHQQGAKYLSAESSDNWGANGLGYFLAARMLWDLKQAEQVEKLKRKFLTDCFEEAAKPMSEFYHQLDSSHPHLVKSDQYGRMFRALAEAKRMTKSAAVQARLDDLTLYCKYIDDYTRYISAEGQARQVAFERMIRHAYRMRKTMLVHSKAVYRDAVNRDRQVSIPEKARWHVLEQNNPWKSSKPFSPSELQEYLQAGIARYPLTKLDFKPVKFSNRLVPVDSLSLRKVKPGMIASGRGVQTFYTYVPNEKQPVELQITGGLIPHYRDRGNVKIELWKIGGASQTGERETLICKDQSVPPNGKEYTVQLTTTEPGLYRVRVSDGRDRTAVRWKAGQPMVLPSSLEQPIVASGRWSLYFYVPRGTRVIGLHGGGAGVIRDPHGKAQFSLVGRKADYYSIKVPQGTAGQLWKAEHVAGSIRLLTVPPWFARSAREMLLPEEVVQAAERANK